MSPRVLNRDSSTLTIIPIKDFSYKGEHPDSIPYMPFLFTPYPTLNPKKMIPNTKYSKHPYTLKPHKTFKPYLEKSTYNLLRGLRRLGGLTSTVAIATGGYKYPEPLSTDLIRSPICLINPIYLVTPYIPYKALYIYIYIMK